MDHEDFISKLFVRSSIVLKEKTSTCCLLSYENLREEGMENRRNFNRSRGSFALPSKSHLPGCRLLFPRIFFSSSEALGKVQSEVLPVTLSDELASALLYYFASVAVVPASTRRTPSIARVKGNKNIAAFKNTIGSPKTLRPRSSIAFAA